MTYSGIFEEIAAEQARLLRAEPQRNWITDRLPPTGYQRVLLQYGPMLTECTIPCDGSRMYGNCTIAAWRER